MDFLSKLFWRALPFFVFAFLYQDGQGKFRAYVDSVRNIQELVDTYKDIQGVAGITAVYYKANQRLPEDFTDFLATTRKYKPRKPQLWQDGWGTAYVLRDLGDRYDIVSCGVDRNCATEHDNIVEHTRKVGGFGTASPAAAGDAAPSEQSQKAAEMFKAATDAKKKVEESQALAEELLKNDPGVPAAPATP